MVRVMSESKPLSKKDPDEIYWQDMKKRILKNEDCNIRLYILDAYNLTPKDSGSDSDP